MLECPVWHRLWCFRGLVWLLYTFSTLILFQIVSNNLRSLEIFIISLLCGLRNEIVLARVMDLFLVRVLRVSLPCVSGRTPRPNSPEIIHTFIKALATLVRASQKVALVVWELIAVLSTHFRTGHKHALVHFALLSQACIVLESIHACLLEDVLHHALFSTCVYLHGLLWLLLFFTYALIWFLVLIWQPHSLLRNLI